MSGASGCSQTPSRAIPATRRVVLGDGVQLPPGDYSTTPGGTLFSTTPGGRQAGSRTPACLDRAGQGRAWLGFGVQRGPPFPGLLSGSAHTAALGTPPSEAPELPPQQIRPFPRIVSTTCGAWGLFPGPLRGGPQLADGEAWPVGLSGTRPREGVLYLGRVYMALKVPRFVCFYVGVHTPGCLGVCSGICTRGSFLADSGLRGGESGTLRGAGDRTRVPEKSGHATASVSPGLAWLARSPLPRGSQVGRAPSSIPSPTPLQGCPGTPAGGLARSEPSRM